MDFLWSVLEQHSEKRLQMEINLNCDQQSLKWRVNSYNS